MPSGRMKVNVPTQRILSTVRPGRIAFLLNIDELEWKYCCLHLFDHFARLWGGYGNIIVPTDRKTIDPVFWTLLEKFDPDHLICYRRSYKDVRIDQPEIFENLLKQHIAAWERQINAKAESYQIDEIKKLLERSHPSDFNISPELQGQLRDRLSPFFFEEWIVEHVLSADEDPGYPHTHLTDVISALRTPFPAVFIPPARSVDDALWAGSQFGYCLPTTLERLETAGLKVIRTTDADATLDSFFNEILAASFLDGRAGRRTSIADASNCGIGTYRSQRFHYWDEPTVVAAGDTLRDFCLYQSMSRLRERVVWLLPSIARDSLSQAHSTEKDSVQQSTIHFLAALHSLTRYSHTHSENVVLISASLEEEHLAAVLDYASRASLFGHQTWSIGRLHDFLGFAPLRRYERNNAQMPTLVAASEDRVIELFEPRRPKFLKDFSPSKVRWISEVTFVGSELPRHFALAQWMMGSSTNTTKEIRISSEGLAFLSISGILFGGSDVETASVRPTIRIPTARQIFEVACRSEKLSCSVSDKGFYTAIAIDKFGGLAKLAEFFRSEIGRAFLAAYRAQNVSDAPGIYLNDDRRRYMDIAALQQIAGDKERAVKLQDEFVEKGIFYRGFIFRCRFCRRCAWFAVADVSDSFVCKRCHREQIYTSANWKMPEQPNWYHQLDEVIYQGLINDMHVPVLALDVLRRRGGTGLTFSEELAYTEGSAKEPFVESDLNCVVDGLLTVGEVKKGDRLGSSGPEEAKTLASYRKLVIALRVRQVVFATEDQRWRKTTEDKIRATFADLPVRLKLLHHNDLYEVS